jgi:hypothetical protein
VVAGLSTYGIGVISEYQDVEQILNTFKDANFSMDKVSVIVRDENASGELATSEQDFIRDKTIEGVTKTGLTAGGIGSLAGLLVGLGLLVIPGVGPIAIMGGKVAVAGLLTGGFYGAAAGGILGAVLGNGVSREQAKIYSEHLAQGNYILIVEGSSEELHQVESTLNKSPIQNWGIYHSS